MRNCLLTFVRLCPLVPDVDQRTTSVNTISKQRMIRTKVSARHPCLLPPFFSPSGKGRRCVIHIYFVSAWGHAVQIKEKARFYIHGEPKSNGCKSQGPGLSLVGVLVMEIKRKHGCVPNPGQDRVYEPQSCKPLLAYLDGRESQFCFPDVAVEV